MSQSSDKLNPDSRPRLQVHWPDGLQREFVLPGSQVVIGRSSETDLPLNHPTVSRRHMLLESDGLSGWRVRDLDSRSGIRLNGRRVDEAVIQPGDTLRLGDLSMQLLVGQSIARGAGRRLEIEADRTDPSMKTWVDFAVPELGVEQFSSVLDLGERLLETSDETQRLECMCELAVSETCRGLHAMVLRIAATDEEAPAALLAEACQATWQGLDGRTRLSRSVLDALRQRGEPIVATNLICADGDDDVAMTLDTSAPSVGVIACPMITTDTRVDLLYVVMPPQYANAEWLALMQLLVRQYRLSSRMLSAVASARREAQGGPARDSAA